MAGGLYSYEFRSLLQARRLRLLGRDAESEELADVDAALARLADGSFGACVDCGAEIERAALKADPTVGRCRTCRVQDRDRPLSPS